jgi:glycosyltransferase involved in cell wall biosynthesis
MTNTKLVSIAMCTYNGERFLQEQLDSILNQSYTNLEIIICDDCSKDNTINIIKKYQKIDHRIILCQNKTNLGFSKNFEKAISLCKGEFIALCDQDDIWKLNKIEKFIAEIGSNVLIYSDAILIDEISNETGKELIRTKQNLCKGQCNIALLLTNFVSGNTMMFSSALKKNILPFSQYMRYHDIEIAFIAATIGNITYSYEAMTYYRRYNNQITHCEKISNKNSWIKYQQKSDNLIRKYNQHLKDLNSFNQLSTLDSLTQEIISSLIIHFQKKHMWTFNFHLFKLLFKYRNQIFESFPPKRRLWLSISYSLGIKLHTLTLFKI